MSRARVAVATGAVVAGAAAGWIFHAHAVGHWSLEHSRSELTAMTAQRAVDIAHLNGHADTSNTATLNVLCGALVLDDAKLSRELADGDWPSSARPAAHALATALDTEAFGFHACATASSFDDATGALAAVSSASEARLALVAALQESRNSGG